MRMGSDQMKEMTNINRWNELPLRGVWVYPEGLGVELCHPGGAQSTVAALDQKEPDDVL